jgi:hypothetical protein
MTIYIYWFRTFSYVGRFLRTTPGLGRGAACTFAHCPVCKDHINASHRASPGHPSSIASIQKPGRQNAREGRVTKYVD